MRPFTSTISHRRSPAPAAGRRCGPIARTERRPPRATAGRPRRGRGRSAPPIRRAAVRAFGDGRVCRRRRRHGAARRGRAGARCASSSGSTPGRSPRARHRTGQLRRNRDRRAAAGRRRRRRHGRGHSPAERRPRATPARRPPPGRTSADAAPTSRRRPRRSRRAICSTPEPHRRAGGASAARTSRSTPGRASRSSPPATKSSSRARRWPAGRSTTSTASRSAAVVAPHGGVAEHAPAGDDSIDALARTRSTRCASADVHRLLGRQFGRRARPASSTRSAGARRADLSRHRRQAGQADGVRHRRRQAVLRHARQSDVVPVERVHPARAVPARDGAPAALRAAHVRAPLGRRIVSQAGRHQFYTVRLARRRRVSRIQRLGRDHQPVTGRRVHRDSRRSDTVEEGTVVEVTLF